jgi:hypothetical protein
VQALTPASAIDALISFRNERAMQEFLELRRLGNRFEAAPVLRSASLLEPFANRLDI